MKAPLNINIAHICLIFCLCAGALLAACAAPATPTEIPTEIVVPEPMESPAPTIPPAVVLSTASFSDFGRTISFTYDPALAQSVGAESVPAVPSSPEVMFSDAHPALVQFSFSVYDGGRPFMLPYPFQAPQLMAYTTQDFAGYGPGDPVGFPQQLDNLNKILENQIDLDSICAQATPGGEPNLPFLPWLNSAQVFCAQPEYVEFNGGRGIRYLTVTAQAPAPVLDPTLFYTFQGVSDDGEIYISTVFPVLSGVFPLEVHTAVDGQMPQNFSPEQFAALQAQPGKEFSPALGQLDALVQSLIIEKQP